MTPSKSNPSHDSKGKFAKGNRGRPKGSRNKVTRTIRQILEKTVDELGVDYFKKLAESHPDVFCKLISNLIPTEFSMDASIASNAPLPTAVMAMPSGSAETYWRDVAEYQQQAIMNGGDIDVPPNKSKEMDKDHADSNSDESQDSSATAD